MEKSNLNFIINFVIMIVVMIGGLFLIVTVSTDAIYDLRNQSQIENLTVLYILQDWSESCGTFTLGCGHHSYLCVVTNSDTGETDRYVFQRGWEADWVGEVKEGTTGAYYVLKDGQPYPKVWSRV